MLAELADVGLVALGPDKGLAGLAAILDSDATPFLKEEAFQALIAEGLPDVGYDSAKDATANAAALDGIRAWLRTRRPR